MLSKSCEYAIKALIYLAKLAPSNSKQGFKEISDAINAPQSFMAKVLQLLVQRGLLLSAKGPGGGFYLPEGYRAFTVAEIIKAIDGEHIFNSCILGLEVCSAKKPCPLHDAYVPIKEQLVTMLEQYTLEQFNAGMIDRVYFFKR